MINDNQIVLVKDMLPRYIIQKGNQFDSIDKIIDLNNINSQEQFIKYMLYLDFYKRKHLNIRTFYSNLNRDVFCGNIEDFYNSLTKEELIALF